MSEQLPQNRHVSPRNLTPIEHAHYQQLLEEMGDTAEVSARLAQPASTTPPYVKYIHDAAKNPDMRALYKEMAAALLLLPPTPEYIHEPTTPEASTTGALHHID